jgi:hypothetical protein
MEYYVTTAKRLCEELEQLHFTETDIQTRADKAAKLIRKSLTSFRRKIRKEDFSSQDSEIHFFKYVKPRINSYLIFYSVLADIETGKLMLSNDEVDNLIEKKLRMFRHIFRENIDFVKYYRAGMTHLDNLYFVRGGNMGSFSKHNTNQLMDPEFNTSHDLVAANIMAYDLYQKHFAPQPSLQAPFGPPQPKLKWTATKLDLVELIYAVQASGAINYGDADLKDICSALETVFSINVGDLYRAFHDISNRKKERIKFVNRLEVELERKILELEGLD